MVPSKETMLASLAQRHGEALQARLCNARIAVCGLGGLGSNVAISLVRLGIGTLYLFDFDKVDISNLNRQQYRVSQLGMDKTDAMKQTLSEIMPYCKVYAVTAKLTESNLDLLASCDIIVEAFDKAEQKAMLINGILERYPEKYIVSGSGMSGYHSANQIVTKKAMNRLYLCGDGVHDVENDGTLFAPRVMVCAAHQATMVLRIIAEEFEV